MSFSILFWNIWFYNQIEGETRTARLLSELDRLVKEHTPDVVALNEVAQSRNGSVAALETLKKLGYNYTLNTRMNHVNNSWLSGAALASRFEIENGEHIRISKDGFAMKRGYLGSFKEALCAQLIFQEKFRINIIVAHPVATVDSLKDHKAGMESLNKLIRSEPYNKNTVLVGDMNEWRLMPGSFRHKVLDVMESRTGTILTPTWRHDAHRFTPLRLNLDYVYWSKRSDFYLKDFRVLSSSVSDHQPLFASFQD